MARKERRVFSSQHQAAVRFVVFLVATTMVLAACGTSQQSADSEHLTVSPATGLQPGERFELHFDERTSRSPAWILSHDGERLYKLADTTRSASPHYSPIKGTSFDVNAVAMLTMIVQFVLPKDLKSGTYRLCNYSRDDLCVSIKVD